VTTSQKAALSLLITVILFTVFTILAFTGLFDLVEARLYNPSIVSAIERDLDRNAATVQDYINELQAKFSETLETPAVKRSFLPNQSAEDIFERSRIYGFFSETVRGVQWIRFIDSGGTRIHFSTSSADILRQDRLSIAYRNFSDPAYSYEELEAAEGADAKYIIDGQADRILFSFPFHDSFDVYRGTAVFSLSAKSVADRLISEGRIMVSQDLAVITDPPGFLSGLPITGDQAMIAQVASVWQEGALRVARLSSGGSVMAFSLFSAKTAKGFYFGQLVDDETFSFPLTMKIILLSSFFMTVYLTVFLLFNLRQDPVTVVQNRLKQLQISLIEQFYERKSDMDWSRWSRELESRKDEINAQLKKGIKKSSGANDIDVLIDKSWDELLSIMGVKKDVKIEDEKLQALINKILAAIPAAQAAAPPVQITAQPQAKPVTHNVHRSPVKNPPVKDDPELDELEAADEPEELEDISELEELAEEVPEEVTEAAEVEEVAEVEELEEVAEVIEAEVEELEAEVIEVESAELEEAVEEVIEAEAVELEEVEAEVAEIEAAEPEETAAEVIEAETEDIEEATVEEIEVEAAVTEVTDAPEIDVAEAEAVEAEIAAEMEEIPAPEEDSVEEIEAIEEVSAEAETEPAFEEPVETPLEAALVAEAIAAEEAIAEAAKETPADAEEVLEEIEAIEELVEAEVLEAIEELDTAEEIEEIEALEEADEVIPVSDESRAQRPSLIDLANLASQIEFAPESESETDEIQMQEDLEIVSPFSTMLSELSKADLFNLSEDDIEHLSEDGNNLNTDLAEESEDEKKKHQKRDRTELNSDASNHGVSAHGVSAEGTLKGSGDFVFPLFSKPFINTGKSKVENLEVISESKAAIPDEEVIKEREGIHYINGDVLSTEKKADEEIDKDFKDLVDSIIK